MLVFSTELILDINLRARTCTEHCRTRTFLVAIKIMQSKFHHFRLLRVHTVSPRSLK